MGIFVHRFFDSEDRLQGFQYYITLGLKCILYFMSAYIHQWHLHIFYSKIAFLRILKVHLSFRVIALSVFFWITVYSPENNLEKEATKSKISTRVKVPWKNSRMNVYNFSYIFYILIAYDKVLNLCKIIHHLFFYKYPRFVISWNEKKIF